MVLFVTMVVLAVAVATTVTARDRKRRQGRGQRAMTALSITGGVLWTAAAAGLAVMSGVHPVLLALVGASLGYAVHRLTQRAFATRNEQRPTALFLLNRRRTPRSASADDITLTLDTIRTLDLEQSEREPLHWSVVAAAGTAATALEGYWAYQHLIAGGGVFSDLSALAGFALLATLTVALTGVAGLAVHMRSTPRLDPASQQMPAPSEMPTIAFTPIQVSKGSRRRSRPTASASR
ncbi:hypothetical protein [Cryptosporangium minutisporangium]|uniref:Uncharacterized protein n=1 Tax=Cryptosporangium minutisporangium TaxID=113569 RepID=A0ABP6SXB3_9ACTN